MKLRDDKVKLLKVLVNAEARADKIVEMIDRDIELIHKEHVDVKNCPKYSVVLGYNEDEDEDEDYKRRRC
ncbi:unnamed protein product [Ambrosiozyma monospora]|uniref:Unnamed protein product n=1 Tax=Ambrosiozyma monospora TaxID=43982 RepID=A0ACB5T9F5_AMBMO|nr:unnamed protein product [Ambrosiozyma monospora]